MLKFQYKKYQLYLKDKKSIVFQILQNLKKQDYLLTYGDVDTALKILYTNERLIEKIKHLELVHTTTGGRSLFKNQNQSIRQLLQDTIQMEEKVTKKLIYWTERYRIDANLLSIKNQLIKNFQETNIQ